MGKTKLFSIPDMPLTPPIFYVLLALSLKERHGYDIMKQVELDSNGKIRLGPGTLYGSVKKMVDGRLIAETKPSAGPGTDTRRRYYRLTDKGRAILTTELQRYRDAVELAKRRKLFPVPDIRPVLVYPYADK
jgi:DNA-binding PadR family transcriptional regulator